MDGTLAYTFFLILCSSSRVLKVKKKTHACRLFDTFFICITVSTWISLTSTQSTSTQASLDAAARDLDIKLAVETNHLTGENYKIVFQLRNTGRNPILTEDDWKIIFSMRDGNNLTRPEFLVHGLAIKAIDGCFFEISKKPGASPRFPGLKPGQAFKITVEKTGLSVFKYDIDNNFYITAPGLRARNIVSTADEDMGFVFLAAANKSADDFSTMNPFRRSIIAADIADMGRLGRDMIIPKTKNITDVVPGNLIDFQDAKKVYVWADSLSTEFKNYLQSKILLFNFMFKACSNSDFLKVWIKCLVSLQYAVVQIAYTAFDFLL